MAPAVGTTALNWTVDTAMGEEEKERVLEYKN